MGRSPYQFRFYGDNSEKNYPSQLTLEELTNNNIFKLYNLNFITQIGIQAMPGTRFKLNNSTNWIEMGSTGIYELDLTNKGNISSIQFDTNTISLVQNKDIQGLMIDVMYYSADNNNIQL